MPYDVCTSDSIAATLSNAKDRRINLRATSAQETLIRTAAERRGISMTDFVLESACTRAEEAIADKVHSGASLAGPEKGAPNQPCGIVLLARLAVNTSEKGIGLGSALVNDALIRAASAAEIVAGRAVLVHALDENARRFYLRFDFGQSPVHPLHLMLLMKDIRASNRKS